MEPKAPALLVVLVETVRLRWFVASIDLDGELTPLLRSETGDLQKYVGLDFDEQVSFLRHRFSGVLQRGCDRLWGRQKKAMQFVFVFEEPLPEPTGELTRGIAQHLAQWMLNPPISFFVQGADSRSEEPPTLDPLAGEMAAPLEELLRSQLGTLRTAKFDDSAWELSPRKPG